MTAIGRFLSRGLWRKPRLWLTAVLILWLVSLSTMLHGASSVPEGLVTDSVVAIVLTAVLASVSSGLIGAWITVHVLRERLGGIERWLRAVDSDVKEIKRDLYRPVVPTVLPPSEMGRDR